MNFFFSILNIIGFVLYIASFLAVFHLLCVYNQKLGYKYYSLVIIVFLGGAFGGYFLRDYAQSQKDILHFEEMLDKQINQGAKYFLDVTFAKLDDEYKQQKIEYIFNKLYDNTLEGKAAFLDDFSKEDLPFINNLRKEVADEIDKIYISAESQNTDNAWRYFSSKISFKLFEKVANKNNIDKEFSKWSSDEDAWKRVMALDSLYLSHEYLSRFPKGVHVVDAKRIILDHEYQDDTRKNLAKVTNYDGTSTFYISNTSSYKVTFSYHGEFAEGNVTISGNSSKTISVPNGYYRVSIDSEKLHTRSINEVVSCNSDYKTYNLQLVRDFR